MPNTSAKICMNSGLFEPPPDTTISVERDAELVAHRVDVVLHRQRDRLEDRPVHVAACVAGVEAEHHPLAERLVGGGQPVEHGHQPVAAGRHLRGLALDVLLARQPQRRRTLGHLVAEQVEEPGEGPHAAAHAVALVQVAVRHAREVGPEVGRVARGSRGRAPSRRCRCRATRAPSSRRATRSRASRRPCRWRSAPRGCPPGCRWPPTASAVTPPITSPGICSSSRCSRRTPNASYSAGSSLHCQVSVSIGHCSRMLFAAVSLNSPGETVGDVARRGGGVRELGIVGQVRLVGPVVHPTDHRLDQRAVGAQERLVAPDRADADGRRSRPDRRSNSSIAWRLAAADRRPQVVVGMEHHAVAGALHRPQHLLAASDGVAGGVVHDDLRALRAAVDADEVGAGHDVVARPPSADEVAAVDREDVAVDVVAGTARQEHHRAHQVDRSRPTGRPGCVRAPCGWCRGCCAWPW